MAELATPECEVGSLALQARKMIAPIAPKLANTSLLFVIGSNSPVSLGKRATRSYAHFSLAEHLASRKETPSHFKISSHKVCFLSALQSETFRPRQRVASKEQRLCRPDAQKFLNGSLVSLGRRLSRSCDHCPEQMPPKRAVARPEITATGMASGKYPRAWASAFRMTAGRKPVARVCSPRRDASARVRCRVRGRPPARDRRLGGGWRSFAPRGACINGFRQEFTQQRHLR
jgi:hypothetical protein